LGQFDLILCGRQAGDVEMGLVGPFLAEEMSLPLVALAGNVELAGSKLKVKCPIEGGYAIFEAPMPCLLTVTNDESNVPRYASIRGIAAARGRIIRAVQLNHIALRVFDHIHAPDKIPIPQPYLTTGRQAVELLGRVLAEIFLLDVQHLGERNLARAALGPRDC
jgi:electron transfer flavoprotein beta subunit